MQHFVFTIFASEAAPPLRKERSFNSETGMRFALQRIPSELIVVETNTKRVRYISNESHHSNLLRVMHLEKTKPFAEWSPLFTPYSTHILMNTAISFHQWIEEIWLQHGHRFPPMKPKLIPKEELEMVVQQPHEYLVHEIIKLLPEHDHGDIEKMCLDENIYVILIKFIREDYAGQAEKMSTIVQALTDVFDKHKKMKTDMVSYVGRLKELEIRNQKIALENESLQQKHEELVQKHSEIKRVVSAHFRDNQIIWD
jgi:hypothetical protein